MALRRGLEPPGFKYKEPSGPKCYSGTGTIWSFIVPELFGPGPHVGFESNQMSLRVQMEPSGYTAEAGTIWQ
jgi:hypothetical protein